MKKVILLILISFAIVLIGLTALIRTGSICIGLGCTGGYHFNDTAIYYAPKSDIKMVIQTSGYVESGHDLGVGKGKVKLFRTNSELDTIRLVTNTEVRDSIIWKGDITPINLSRMHPGTLYNFLDSIGINEIDSLEIGELTEAMVAVNYGHKTGFVNGQTQFIEVVQRK